MMKQVRLSADVAAQVEVVASAERRSLANMVEVLLLAALTERERDNSAPGTDPGTPGVRLRGTAVRVPDTSRSVSPADVAATIDGVSVVRPHMRKDRPAIQCEARIVAGQTCTVCGTVVT